MARTDRTHNSEVDALVSGLRGGGSDRQDALVEFAMEESEHDAVEAVGQLGIVAQAFVAHEGVGAVDGPRS